MNFEFLPLLSGWLAEIAALSWRGGWLVLALLGLRLLVRGRVPAQLWYLVWVVLAVRLLVPASVPATWSPYNLASLLPLAKPTAAVDTRPTAELEGPSSAAFSRFEHDGEPGSVPPSAAAGSDSAGPALAVVWLAGVALFIGMRLLGVWRLRRRLSAARPANERVREVAAREGVALGVTANVICLETAAVSAPALFGLFRPWLLFPPELVSRLSDDELRLVIRHELAHWRRRDLLAQLMMQAAVAVHWFNPLVWLAAHVSRIDCELACDELVLRRSEPDGGPTYGATLLKVLSLVGASRGPAAAVGILESKRQLSYRIRRIAGHRPATVGAAVAGVLMLAAIAVTSATSEAVAADSPRAQASGAGDASGATPERQSPRVDEFAPPPDERKEGSRLSELEHRRKLLADSRKAMNLEAQRATIVLGAAETRLRQIEEFRERGVPLTNLAFIASQPVVAELMKTESAQRLAIHRLSERYRDKHPELISARNALAHTERELRRAVTSICEQVAAEHAVAREQHSARQAELLRLKADSLELDRAAVEVLRSGEVSIVGGIQQPGRYALADFATDRKPTLLDLVARAGGATPTADLRRVRVTRVDLQLRSTREFTVDVDGMMRRARMDPDWAATTLEAGDIVVVPEARR